MLISTNDSCLFQVNEWQGTVPVLPVVVVTDAYGCSNNNPLNSTQLLEYPVLSLTTFSTDCSSVSSQDGAASVAIAGGEAPFSILWNNGATTQVINNLSPGNYCVTVVDNFACSSIQCVQVLYPLQTQSPDNPILKLWPNPARAGDWIHLKLPQISTENSCKVEIIDATGRKFNLVSTQYQPVKRMQNTAAPLSAPRVVSSQDNYNKCYVNNLALFTINSQKFPLPLAIILTDWRYMRLKRQ